MLSSLPPFAMSPSKNTPHKLSARFGIPDCRCRMLNPALSEGSTLLVRVFMGINYTMAGDQPFVWVGAVVFWMPFIGQFINFRPFTSKV